MVFNSSVKLPTCRVRSDRGSARLASVVMRWFDQVQSTSPLEPGHKLRVVQVSQELPHARQNRRTEAG